MSAIDRFLSVTRAYQALSGLRTTNLSWRLFGDSKKLGRLENGADIQVTRYENALQWLSDHWPDPEPWPANAAVRPPKSPGVETVSEPAEPEAA